MDGKDCLNFDYIPDKDTRCVAVRGLDPGGGGGGGGGGRGRSLMPPLPPKDAFGFQQPRSGPRDAHVCTDKVRLEGRGGGHVFRVFLFALLN